MREKSIRSVRGLVSALDLDSRELIALVGGGGKTSLLFALADELLRAGKKVVTTTTTKIWHREALRSPCIVFTRSAPSWRKRLMAGLQTHGQVFLAGDPLDSGKVDGIGPSLVNDIYQEGEIDYIIVEADGAAGCPVKAPAEHEPVIPASTTMVVAMLGLEAIGEPMSPEVVFRADLFAKLTGTEPEQRITPAVLSGLFLKPEGLFKGGPPGVRKMVFLNKRDLLTEGLKAEKLAGLVLENESNKVDQVVIGSILEGTYSVLGHFTKQASAAVV